MAINRRKMIYATVAIAGTAVVAKYLIGGVRDFANANSVLYFRAPEFSDTSSDAWLNSDPILMSDLRGQVIMLDFWTFGCWNCYRSFPWMNEMEKRLEGEDFRIIGIHTPEYEHEKIRANIEEKIAEFKLTHPTMMDNNFEYWNAMNNRYWPSYFLVDKKGFVRKNFVGETHAQTAKAIDIESSIRKLLIEPA